MRDLLGAPAHEAAADEAADSAAEAAAERTFEAEGVTWVARPAGLGAYGTGRLGVARLEAVHFFRADAPHRPVREALIQAGTLSGLYGAELGSLLERATPMDHGSGADE